MEKSAQGYIAVLGVAEQVPRSESVDFFFFNILLIIIHEQRSF